MESPSSIARLGPTELLRLLDDSCDIVFHYRLRPQPGFTYVNGACTSITGYTPEEHYADPRLLLTMIDPRDRDRLMQIAAGQAFADGSPYLLRWVRKDGKTIWTEQRLFVDRGTDGKPEAFHGVVRDATARVEADEQLHAALATNVRLVDELRAAMDRVKTLSGLLPICASCKNIRNDQGYWVQIDAYLAAHTDAEFTHSICGDCYRKLYGPDDVDG